MQNILYYQTDRDQKWVSIISPAYTWLACVSLWKRSFCCVFSFWSQLSTTVFKSNPKAPQLHSIFSSRQKTCFPIYKSSSCTGCLLPVFSWPNQISGYAWATGQSSAMYIGNLFQSKTYLRISSNSVTMTGKTFESRAIWLTKIGGIIFCKFSVGAFCIGNCRANQEQGPIFRIILEVIYEWPYTKRPWLIGHDGSNSH